MRLSFGSLAPVLALLALASSCQEEEGANLKSFTDQAGRSCETDPHDIRAVADCDADPATLVTCAAGKEAVFTIGGTIMGELENCAGCLDEAAKTTVVDGNTCAFVTCETDADCVEDRYTCQSNTCKS